MRDLSVVMPAHNEEGNIAHALRYWGVACRDLSLDYELVVVDDGSVDQTSGLVGAVAVGDPRVRLLRHERRQGYGAALRSGIAATRGDLVLITDADLQFDMCDLERMLPWTRGFEVVVGYRAIRRDPWLRRLNGRLWGWLVGWVFQLDVRDPDCAFKIIHGPVLRAMALRAAGALISAELIAKARAAGCSICEVPVRHFPRRSGRATGGQARVIAHAFVETWQFREELRGLRSARPPLVS